MKVWEQIRRFEELRAANASANNVTVVKEALAPLGLCRRDVRPPCRLLPEDRARRGRRHRRGMVDMTGEEAAGAPEELRSHQWYGTDGAALLQPPGPHAPARLPARGAPGQARSSRSSTPGPTSTPATSTCATAPQAVKRGVWQAGGFPLEFPVSTLCETFQKPTPMLYRNLLAMETEELLRSYPVDGAVLLGGCDKTTPALLMGAASADLPALFVPAGPMLPGHWRGEILGSGTDMWKYWDDKRAGPHRRLRDGRAGERPGPFARPLHDHGHGLHPDRRRRGPRHDAAGRLLHPGRGLRARPDGRRVRAADRRTRPAGPAKPSQILTRDAFEDAVTTVLGLGGSTNAVIHLIAMAGRAGVELTLDDFDRIARTVPVLANVRPGGQTYLMEDFHFAGRAARLPLPDHRPAPPGPAHRRVRHPAASSSTSARRPRRRRDPHPRQPGRRRGRRRRPARQPLPGRRGHQAHRRRAAPAQAHRARRRLRRLPDHAAHHQRPGPRHHRRHRAGAAQLRTQGRPRHARVRHAPDPRPPAQAGRTGHGPDLRRPDERHQLRHLRPARRARVVRRRTARPGPHRRPRSPSTSRRAPSNSTWPTRSWRRRRAEWTPPPARYERGYGALYNDQITQADTGCDFEFLARPGKVPDPYAG